MGEFPSGQRGQTVNLLLIASVVRIHPLPPKLNPKVDINLEVLALSNRKFLNFLLAKKSTYGSAAKRNDSHDSDFFIFRFQRNPLLMRFSEYFV